MRILDGSLSSELHLPGLARNVGVSPSRLWHMFKVQTGLTPAAYLRSARMLRAAELLLLSRQSVKEIAPAVGFKSVSHFVHAFRRAYSMPPRHYRSKANKP